MIRTVTVFPESRGADVPLWLRGKGEHWLPTFRGEDGGVCGCRAEQSSVIPQRPGMITAQRPNPQTALVHTSKSRSKEEQREREVRRGSSGEEEAATTTSPPGNSCRDESHPAVPGHPLPWGLREPLGTHCPRLPLSCPLQNRWCSGHTLQWCSEMPSLGDTCVPPALEWGSLL